MIYNVKIKYGWEPSKGNQTNGADLEVRARKTKKGYMVTEGFTFRYAIIPSQFIRSVKKVK